MVRIKQWIIGVAVVTAAVLTVVMLLLPTEADRLRKEKEALAREKVELERSIERLTGEDRVAEVHVVDQVMAGTVVDGKPVATDLTTLEFIELDREGRPLPSRRVTVQGTRPHFEALVIMFSPKYVAMGDSLRGRSLALFRGIYGEMQRPVDAVRLDKEGDVPNIYRVNPEPSQFELKLWSRFWDYTRDKALRERDGVELTQGQDVFNPMRKGDIWTITLQHSAGLKLMLHHMEPGSGPGRGNQAERVSTQGGRGGL